MMFREAWNSQVLNCHWTIRAVPGAEFWAFPGGRQLNIGHGIMFLFCAELNCYVAFLPVIFLIQVQILMAHTLGQRFLICF
jgi:hypothetical protein